MIFSFGEETVKLFGAKFRDVGLYLSLKGVFIGSKRRVIITLKATTDSVIDFDKNQKIMKKVRMYNFAEDGRRGFLLFSSSGNYIDGEVSLQ